MTFTKEELERFAADYYIFVNECMHVVKILEKLHYRYEDYDYDGIGNWSINPCGDLVEGKGGNYRYICFPSDYLTKTDEELISVVEADEKERIRKLKEEEEKNRLKEEEKTRQKELAELKRLKEKYEKET